MSDVSPQEEELPDGDAPAEEEPEAPTPESLAAELGLNLTPEEQAEADQMVARLRSQFGLEDQEESPVDEPQEEEAPEEEPEVPETPAVETQDWITIGDRTVPVAEARSMLELRQFLAQHPEKADAVRKAIEGEPVAEKPEEVNPPEWLDLEDPAQKFFWSQFQEQGRAINQIAENQRRNAEQAARADALQAVNVAMTTFRNNHPELTEDEVQIVRTHAVALNIIPGLQQSRSGTDAVLKALDIAYMDHPDFRAKQTGQPTAAEVKKQQNKERKEKLAGIGGSSTGASRQPEPPKKPESDREMRSQAAQWLAEQGII